MLTVKVWPINTTLVSLHCDVTDLNIVNNMIGWLSAFGSTDDETLIKNVR